MLIEQYNVAGALAALAEPSIETRICVSVQPDATVRRFVRDDSEVIINGWTFGPVPFAEFDTISSEDGNAADTTTITLDGKYMVTATDTTPDDVFRDIIQYPLRDRPIQIGLLVFNVDTKAAIGLIPQFVGFIDNAPLERSKNGSKLMINCASFRAYAQRRVARTYSQTDHVTRFPGDNALKWIADAVFRNGKYIWNRNAATASGGGNTGGGGGGGLHENFRFVEF
jgi:hypothetical protein